LATRAHHHLFYAGPEAAREGCLYFSPEESAHILLSLRLPAGSPIRATDGKGKLYEARIEEARRDGVVARIESVDRIPAAAVKVMLFQGMIRLSRMDLVVEKCVELGVDAVIPLVSERSTAKGAGGRTERWRKIAVGAMKQSLRAYLPEIRPVTTFSEAVEAARGLGRILAAHERGAVTPLGAGDLAGGGGDIGVFVGPEGGFSHEEIEALRAAGALFFGLGEARLRSETAAIAAVAIIRHFLQ
jgi:16S rRNA (uracil1498-N3)-methyltransferase